MKKTERVRQVLTGPLQEADLKQNTEKGWKAVAIEWEREVETSVEALPGDVPFGLKLSADTCQLVDDPDEREILFQMMQLMVEEGSYARIAEEINRRGFRTRDGFRWTAVSVFEMLPRLIEVGPQVFRSEEWEKRRGLSSKAQV
jgi:hypothetical protein